MPLSDEQYDDLVEAKQNQRSPRELLKETVIRLTVLETLLIEKGLVEKKEVDDLMAIVNSKIDQTAAEFQERYYKERPTERIMDQLFGPGGVLDTPF